MGAWHYPHNTPQPLAEAPPVDDEKAQPVKTDEPQVIRTRPVSEPPKKGAKK